jgi:hypothetical protein
MLQKKILKEIRPVFYIEVGTDSNTKVAEVFERNNYLLFDGSKSLNSQKPQNKCFFNTLAIPKETYCNSQIT